MYDVWFVRNGRSFLYYAIARAGEAPRRWMPVKNVAQAYQRLNLRGVTRSEIAQVGIADEKVLGLT